MLETVSLEVGAGALLAVLGRSGSGKTTLLRLVAGFERLDAGSIAVDGEPVAATGFHLAPERRRIGYVAQEGALFPHLPVAENIVFGLPRAVRRRGRERRARVERLLLLVGLPADFADRWPQELSGGEQQRVALARALAPSPRLVLLDEPFSSLDAALRTETRDAVARALAEAGATAVMVTHDQGEALSMGHEVAVLRDGRLVQVASPERLYGEPADVALARFVGDAVLLPAIVRNNTAHSPLGVSPLRRPFADGAATVMLRPEQLLLSPAAPDAQPKAIVRAVSFHGPDALVLLGTGDGTVVRARVAGHRAPVAGSTVALSVDGAVLAFAPDAAADPSPTFGGDRVEKDPGGL